MQLQNCRRMFNIKLTGNSRTAVCTNGVGISSTQDETLSRAMPAFTRPVVTDRSEPFAVWID